MMSDIRVDLLGDDELMAVLQKLPGRLGKKFVQDAWSKSATPIKKAMKANIPSKSGTARKSVRLKRGKSYKTPTVFVGPMHGRGASADAWYLKFLWRGTRYIRPKTGMTGYEAAVNAAIKTAEKSFRTEIIKRIKRSL